MGRNYGLSALTKIKEEISAYYGLPEKGRTVITSNGYYAEAFDIKDNDCHIKFISRNIFDINKPLLNKVTNIELIVINDTNPDALIADLESIGFIKITSDSSELQYVLLGSTNWVLTIEDNDKIYIKKVGSKL